LASLHSRFPFKKNIYVGQARISCAWTVRSEVFLPVGYLKEAACAIPSRNSIVIFGRTPLMSSVSYIAPAALEHLKGTTTKAETQNGRAICLHPASVNMPS